MRVFASDSSQKFSFSVLTGANGGDFKPLNPSKLEAEMPLKALVGQAGLPTLRVGRIAYIKGRQDCLH